MTDLRTAAQAVIDEYSKHGLMMVGYDSGQIALAKLRQALAAPEPSVDALIAEAVAKEREECAKLCSGLVKSQVVRSWASHDELEAFDYCANKIRARGQK